uniref:Receptor-like serine/threonine-protein kinase n=1 Tax=Nelumbo nucifera TaxID=4432 RepID=A0A1U8AE91_NELNU
MASALVDAATLLVLLLLLNRAAIKACGKVALGSSLSAIDDSSKSSWSSPSGEFKFGFRRLDKTDLFLLSIWFDKIPDKTMAWYANGNNPAPRGSTVQLTSDGGLELNDPQGQEIWKSEPIGGAVAYGEMLDTGNFVLVATANKSNNIWESFKHPSDTLLPTQVLEVDGVVSSRLTKTNYSTGRFQLRHKDGNLVLNTVGIPATFAYDTYYESGNSVNANDNDSLSQTIFTETGFIYILIRNGSRVGLNTQDFFPRKDHYYRATLDFDGVFAQYIHPKNSSGNQAWSMVWHIPDDICMASKATLGSGTCGFNSICNLTADKRPTCYCPPKYSMEDPNNMFSSCVPDHTQVCNREEPGSSKDVYGFEVLLNTDWPFSDYEQFYPFTEDQCRNACLRDCQCAVAVIRDQNCWKKRLPLSNGKVNSQVNINGKTFMKVRVDSRPTEKERHEKVLIVIVSLLLGSSVFVNLLLLGGIFLYIYIACRNKLKKAEEVKLKSERSVVGGRLCSFTYRDLEEATNEFKEELGRGAFAVVYKGVLELGGKKLVAVKKLDRVVQEREKEFKTELGVIGQTHHKNLVQLLGFCDEGQHRLLVYEFMSNGTLANFLFEAPTRPAWNQRTQIAFGIARGLLYLHEECSTHIIHCDVKPQNILLDDCFTAKISDFGLAKLLMTDQSRTHTVIRGTKGYVAPEWFRTAPVTSKVDVYSFGVVLLEIICCRKNIPVGINESNGGEILTDLAYDCFCQGRLDDLLENDIEAMNDMSTLDRFLRVAIWCIQEEPSLRPTMRKVTQMLEGVTEVPVPPSPSPFGSVLRS